jgi:hypothetical protein
LQTIRHAPPRPWRESPPAVAWEVLLWSFADLFTKPSFQHFMRLITAWSLCPGRRTITRLITLADPKYEHAHDAYHRFIRAVPIAGPELAAVMVAACPVSPFAAGRLHRALVAVAAAAEVVVCIRVGQPDGLCARMVPKVIAGSYLSLRRQTRRRH